ncbi:MAG TPA: tetraacyldisaccharide 4'-kinase [Burkholderiaceae bacterium]|nr:tetraacyldisaccharide 4'-kinase [Burkholderiaceae bacterium]
MAGRASLEAALSAAWQRRGALAWLLLPVALLFRVALAVRRAAYSAGILQSLRPTVPVIVIGNLYVGGTGKTPLTIALVRALQQRGWRPGVVSRGYGAETGPAPRIVSVDDPPAEVGDEPLLIARATGAAVCVAARRAAAATALLAAEPACNVIVADDALQHLALARDVEIAVVDDRGLGNGWLLPAGPLREPAGRLARADAVVAHNTDCGAIGLPQTSCHAMRTHLAAEAYALADRDRTLALDELARRQRAGGLRIAAAAGIGVPDRFFAMLTAAGLAIEPIPLPDHHAYADGVPAGRSVDFVLVTEKDAVKCERISALRQDPRLWVVPLLARIDETLIDLVAARLNRLSKAPHGPPPA